MTPSSSPISGIDRSVSRYFSTDVLEITFSADILASCVKRSSCMPSTKNTSASFALRLAKGRTAIEGLPSVAITSPGSGVGCGSVETTSVRACSSSEKLTYSEMVSAITSTPIMMRSSLRPVTCVIDSLRSTSFSRFIPSGVSSNAQANSSATGNPMTSSNKTRRPTQSGRANIGATISTTCSSSQVTTI